MTKIDLIIDKGQTFKRAFQFTQDGTPIDLTGYSVRIQARTQKVAGAELIIDLDTASEVTTNPLTIGVDGTVTMVLSRDATRLLREGTFPWELELTTPDDESSILAGGMCRVVIGVIQ